MAEGERGYDPSGEQFDETATTVFPGARVKKNRLKKRTESVVERVERESTSKSNRTRACINYK